MKFKPLSISYFLTVIFMLAGTPVCWADNARAYLLIEVAVGKPSQEAIDKLGGLQNCKGSGIRGHGNEIVATIECNSPDDLNFAMSNDLKQVPGVTTVTLMRVSP